MLPQVTPRVTWTAVVTTTAGTATSLYSFVHQVKGSIQSICIVIGQTMLTAQQMETHRLLLPLLLRPLLSLLLVRPLLQLLRPLPLRRHLCQAPTQVRVFALVSRGCMQPLPQLWRIWIAEAITIAGMEMS
jgi:hypothetical protein